MHRFLLALVGAGFLSCALLGLAVAQRAWLGILVCCVVSLLYPVVALVWQMTMPTAPIMIDWCERKMWVSRTRTVDFAAARLELEEGTYATGVMVTDGSSGRWALGMFASKDVALAFRDELAGLINEHPTHARALDS
jgi:hypothetical protein